MAAEPWQTQADKHRAVGNIAGAELFEAVARHDATLVAAIDKVTMPQAQSLSPEVEAASAERVARLASTHINAMVHQAWARQAMMARLQGAAMFAAGIAGGVLLWSLR